VSGQPTGYQAGTYSLPPIGTAELLAQDDETEFGIGEGWPHDYSGTTPEPQRIIGVGRHM
jgi:hypothetical protein